MGFRPGQKQYPEGSGPTTERVYINANVNHASKLMEHIVRKIIDNPKDFPGVNAAKISGPVDAGKRADSIVIFTNGPRAIDRVLIELAAYQRQHPEHFMDGSPPVTFHRFPGVSTAAQPSGGGSFGSVRSRALYEALEDVRTRMDKEGTNFDVESYFRERVRERFMDADIDPDNPHANLRAKRGK